MPTHSFSAELNLGKSKINMVLGVYIFSEENIYIAYCPALDLSGYGENEHEARESFAEVMRQYFDYCIQNNTLAEDLRKHGWTVKDSQKQTVQSPDVATMMKNNSAFTDILNNKEYSKYSQNMTIPSFA